MTAVKQKFNINLKSHRLALLNYSVSSMWTQMWTINMCVLASIPLHICNINIMFICQSQCLHREHGKNVKKRGHQTRELKQLANKRINLKLRFSFVGSPALPRRKYSFNCKTIELWGALCLPVCLLYY